MNQGTAQLLDKRRRKESMPSPSESKTGVSTLDSPPESNARVAVAAVNISEAPNEGFILARLYERFRYASHSYLRKNTLQPDAVRTRSEWQRIGTDVDALVAIGHMERAE